MLGQHVDGEFIEGAAQILIDTDLMVKALQYSISHDEELGERLNTIANRYRISELIDIMTARHEGAEAALMTLGIWPNWELHHWEEIVNKELNYAERVKAKKNEKNVKQGESSKE